MTREAAIRQHEAQRQQPVDGAELGAVEDLAPRRACGQIAGTANNRIRAAATDNAVPRTRVGNRAHRFETRAQASSIFSGTSSGMRLPTHPDGVNGKPAGSGKAPPGYEPIFVPRL